MPPAHPLLFVLCIAWTYGCADRDERAEGEPVAVQGRSDAEASFQLGVTLAREGRQQRDGRWDSPHGGAYATGMSLIVLQMPYRLLPIYQR